jgi:hypothetical protein
MSLSAILSSLGQTANAGGRKLHPVVTRQMNKVGEMKTLGVGMLQMVTMSLIQLVFRSSNLHY